MDRQSMTYEVPVTGWYLFRFPHMENPIYYARLIEGVSYLFANNFRDVSFVGDELPKED